MRRVELSAMLLAAATLASCTSTPSREDFELGRKVINESSTARRKVVADCTAKLSRASSTDRSNLAAVMNVPPARAPGVFCGRVIRAFADGRITREDLAGAQRSGDYSKFIRVVQRR